MFISSGLSNSCVIIKDSNKYELPAKVVVTHSKSKLPFTVLQSDTIVNDTMLKPILSDIFWWGNVGCLSYLAPVGWLIDLTNDKRFIYGNHIHIDSLGNIMSFKDSDKLFFNKYSDLFFHKHKKRNINLILSAPEVNLFHLSLQNETPRNFAGFLGLGTGVEYFYKNDKSLQLRIDAITNYIAPFPLPIDWDEPLTEPLEDCLALNINLTNNFRWKRFHFGYGLNFAKNIWYRSAYYIEPQKPTDENYEYKRIDGISKTNTMLGFVSNTYYRLFQHFYLGVIYRPSFWNLSNHKLMYEHSISFDFMWKLYLKTK
jgi:hypothetical protein